MLTLRGLKILFERNAREFEFIGANTAALPSAPALCHSETAPQGRGDGDCNEEYDTQDIRNVVLVGHGGAGKTSLAEAILFDGKGTNRRGQAGTDTSNFDYEPEEIKRQGTIQTSVGYVEWQKKKINFIDTPGDQNFLVETRVAMQIAADAAIVVVSCPDGVQVGTEKVWQYCEELELPRAIFVNKMDRERADLGHLPRRHPEDPLREGDRAAAPHRRRGRLRGRDRPPAPEGAPLLRRRPRGEGRGRSRRRSRPTAQQGAREAHRGHRLVRRRAPREVPRHRRALRGGGGHVGLKKAMNSGHAHPGPLRLGGAEHRHPAAARPHRRRVPVARHPPRAGRAGREGRDRRARRPRSTSRSPPASSRPSAPTSARSRWSRVLSGKLTADSTISNSTRDASERTGSLYALVGKKRETVPEVDRRRHRRPRQAQGHQDRRHARRRQGAVQAAPPDVPAPVITYAIHAKSQGRRGQARRQAPRHQRRGRRAPHRARPDVEGDPARRHGPVAHRGRRREAAPRLGVEVELLPPKIPYLETIKGKAKNVEGKHKKQTGGKGQFGVVLHRHGAAAPRRRLRVRGRASSAARSRASSSPRSRRASATA